MAHVRVGSGADELVPDLDRDSRAPVVGQDETCPDRCGHTCIREHYAGYIDPARVGYESLMQHAEWHITRAQQIRAEGQVGSVEQAVRERFDGFVGLLFQRANAPDNEKDVPRAKMNLPESESGHE